MADSFLYERVTKIETTHYICRIWATDDEKLDLFTITKDAESDLRYLETDQNKFLDVMKSIVTHEGVNSVELIRRSTGSGVCIHKNWP